MTKCISRTLPFSSRTNTFKMQRALYRPILASTRRVPLAAAPHRFSSTFVPSFAPTGSTSAQTQVPYGDPSLASSAYLPAHPDHPVASSSAIVSAATTETPSDLTPKQRQVLERIIRVDQAGELGANYIYMGQLAVLSRGKDKKVADLVQVSESRIDLDRAML